jgi:prevent-host-death family protein
MWLQEATSIWMKATGIREVKNNLSAYIRAVKRGKVIRITDRGEVVAELRPPSSSSSEESIYERLVEEGKVIPPSRPFSAKLVSLPRAQPKFPAGYANELIDADRDERG